MIANLYDQVTDELCPDGIWQLGKTIETLLTRHINRLPRTKVSEEETRYPTTPAGMRAFLGTFFARHYFQVQNSLLDYLLSTCFLDFLRAGELNILDIGSGPAVASLAITDMLACILRHLRKEAGLSNVNKIKINYVLNDITGICLGLGQELLTSFFRMSSQCSPELLHNGTLALQKYFPSNMNQLKRICCQLGRYDLINFCYVINPLNEEIGLIDTVDGIRQVEKLCCPTGRVLIVQDKFSEQLIRRIAHLIGKSCRTDTLRQRVYSTVNDSDEYTYSYRYCLFLPYVNNIKSGMVSA